MPLIAFWALINLIALVVAFELRQPKDQQGISLGFERPFETDEAFFDPPADDLSIKPDFFCSKLLIQCLHLFTANGWITILNAGCLYQFPAKAVVLNHVAVSDSVLLLSDRSITANRLFLNIFPVICSKPV